jgi:hypothetical protein
MGAYSAVEIQEGNETERPSVTQEKQIKLSRIVGLAAAGATLYEAPRCKLSHNPP